MLKFIDVTREGTDLPPCLVHLLDVRITERCPARINTGIRPDLTILLNHDPHLPPDGFRIETAGLHRIRIAGHGARGVLAGMGHFLRSSEYHREGFEPSSWQGIRSPKKPVRGIYFATHFHNYYHDAPLSEVERYVEDLGLWGFNILTVWFDLHHFQGIHDPEAQQLLTRLRTLLGAARRIGLQTGLMVLGNEAYANSPPELRADLGELWAYGVELCPAKPGATDLMLRWFDEEFKAFSDLSVDYLGIGPYDQGGCTCENCRPWGGNGFLKMAARIAPVFQKYSPTGRIVLTTWLFDHAHHRYQGDWIGLAQMAAEHPAWMTAILAGTHEQRLPEYLQKHPVPGGLPLLGFPEISMRGMCPWGGFGANPQPAFFQRYWDEWGPRIDGGFPYSEGLYEDMNKAIMAQLYWNDQSPETTLRQYIAYEFSPSVTESVLNAIRILENNQIRTWVGGDFSFPHTRLNLPPDAGSAQAKKLLNQADKALPASVRLSWRWRVLWLRAFIDNALFQQAGAVPPECEPGFEELTRLYHAEKAEFLVHPPTLKTR